MVINRHEVLFWLDRVFPILHESHWKNYLMVEGLDLLEIIRTPIYYALMNSIRDAQPAAGKGKVSKLDQYSFIERIRSVSSSFLQDYIVKGKTCGPSKANIVFIPREPTHIKAQVPVAQQLGELNIRYIFVVNDVSAFMQLEKNGIRAVYARGAWPKLLDSYRRKGLLSAKLLLKEATVKLPSFSIPGEGKKISRILQQTICQLLPHVYCGIACLKGIEEFISPELIVVGNDISFEGRTACLWGQKKRIPTVCLMHGSVIGDPLHRYHITDQYLTYGPHSKSVLEKFGIDPVKVTACGAPYLSRKPVKKKETDFRLIKKFDTNKYDQWILIATSGPGNSISLDHHKILIKSIMRLSKQFEQICFIAKLHRKDRKKYYKELLPQVPESKLNIVSYGSKGLPDNIFNWLHGCSAVLTCASTVAVEAMLMDVPVITMDFNDELNGIDFIDADATLHSSNTDELERAIQVIASSNELINSKKRNVQNFLAGQFYDLHGNAAMNCAKTVQQMQNNQMQIKNI